MTLSHKSEPLLWVVGDHGGDDVFTDSSVLHLGHHILQQMTIAMTTIAHLSQEMKTSQVDHKLGGYTHFIHAC